MKQYKIQITDKALSDMQEIYNYIAEQLQAPETAMGQYNRIADAIETLDTFPERVRLMETEEERALGIRQMPVDNFSVFFHIREERVIITNVLVAEACAVNSAGAFLGEDGIKELRDSGLSFLLVGLESLNDKNLERTKRKSRQEFMEKTLSLLKKLNIAVTSTYMICFEDDTEKSIREAKKRIIDLGVTVSLFNITVPLPGTPLYHSYKNSGMINDWNWSHWTFGHFLDNLCRHMNKFTDKIL